ncbi:heterokaryon incompatibility protein [Colletotrichum kahawae]|uniref:Heterokaryon incompatibility protein n=1 Tax=Colletotrichum kahawae TaxID=34407 RepID=A0AAD9YNT4_COLKA|nr:heterokaryon incompatibility protein [Colletotrichum kahawae]
MHPKGMDHYEGRATEMPRYSGQPWKELLAAKGSATGRLGPPEPPSTAQFLADWNATVEHYSNLHLTMASDKLVALSGLASDLKRRLNELQPGPHRYLAGLWEEELITQLAWEVEGSAKRVSQYRAPSWSWACLDGEIQRGAIKWKQIRADDLASMISAEMVYSSEETGEVKSGILTLEGPYTWAKLSPSPRAYEPCLSFVELPSSALKPWSVSVRFDTLSDVAEEAFLLWTCNYVTSYLLLQKGLALAVTENDTFRRIGAVCLRVDANKGLKYIEALPLTRVRII